MPSGLLFGLGAVLCKRSFSLFFALCWTGHSCGVPHPFHAVEWTFMKQSVNLNVSLVFGSLISVYESNMRADACKLS